MFPFFFISLSYTKIAFASTVLAAEVPRAVVACGVGECDVHGGGGAVVGLGRLPRQAPPEPVTHRPHHYIASPSYS